MLLEGQSVRDWVGEFQPKRVRVIPLIEDMESLLHCDSIVEEYVRHRDLPHQRVFLARSDPALNYGIVGAELMLKVGLLRLHNLETRLGLPLYPIIGAGSVPFRGHLTPLNVERAQIEYSSAHTLTVQSAFKYDYDTSCPQGNRADSRSRAGRACTDRSEARLRHHRQDNCRVPGKCAEADRHHQGRIGSCSKAARTETPRRPLWLRSLSWRGWRGYASPGNRLYSFPVLHRRSAGIAGPCFVD